MLRVLLLTGTNRIQPWFSPLSQFWSSLSSFRALIIHTPVAVCLMTKFHSLAKPTPSLTELGERSGGMESVAVDL